MLFSIQDLNVTFEGKPVLDKICLSIPEGQICTVLGEEGSGKSTMQNAILQIIPSRGKLQWGETDLYSIPTHRFIHIGIDYVRQGGNILRRFTGSEHIELALIRCSNQQKKKRWEEILITFPRMNDLQHRVAGQMSGGERQILSLACLLACDSQLILLDEPTAGLAPEIVEAIVTFIKHMSTIRKTSFLIFEHHYSFAFDIADLVYLLKNQMLSQPFSPDVFRQPSFLNKYLYDITY